MVSKKITDIEFQMSEFLKQNLKPKITIESDKLFLKANICWLCDIGFIKMLTIKLDIIVN